MTKRITFAALFFLYLFIAAKPGEVFASRQTKKIDFSGTCVTAEVAASTEARNKGLMFRKQLEPGSCMLFVFEKEGRYSFWMKNMLFPIDIIWLDKEKRVVAIKENAPVCTDDCPAYQPNADARYVIETVAGFIRSHGVKTGDQVSF